MSERAKNYDRRGANSTSPSGSANANAVNEVFGLVKSYARQETLGPLSGIGRWIGAGIAGALCLGIGGVLMLLAGLRLLQTEISFFKGHGFGSVLAYFIVLVVSAAIIGLAALRIKKTTLDKRGHR